MEANWPYNLPIWRRYHRVVSPDGKLVARIDPAYEVSMGNPTAGMLCVSPGLHIPRCNPSFVWSDDSRFLAVPQFFNWLGWFTRQRLLVVDFGGKQVYTSKMTAWYFQPETFINGTLLVTVNPFKSKRSAKFCIPKDFTGNFARSMQVAWPETSCNSLLQ